MHYIKVVVKCCMSVHIDFTGMHGGVERNINKYLHFLHCILFSLTTVVHINRQAWTLYFLHPKEILNPGKRRLK